MRLRLLSSALRLTFKRRDRDGVIFGIVGVVLEEIEGEIIRRGPKGRLANKWLVPARSGIFLVRARPEAIPQLARRRVVLAVVVVQ